MNNLPVERNPESEWNIMQQQAEILVKSGMLPKNIKNANQVVALSMKAKELNIGPMEAISNLYIVNGKVTANAQLMLSLAYRSGLLEEFQIDGTSDKCTVKGKRKDGPSYSSTWTFADAKRAGLAGSDTYRKYPAVMLRWRAITEVLRVLVPDVVAGMYSPDELGVPYKASEGGIEIDYKEISAEQERAAERIKTPKKEEIAVATQIYLDTWDWYQSLPEGDRKFKLMTDAGYLVDGIGLDIPKGASPVKYLELKVLEPVWQSLGGDEE